MKKIIVLKSNDGRLANQLWLSANIYAFCLEKNLKYSNPSFYRYNHYFNFKKGNLFEKMFIRGNKITFKILIIIYNTIIKARCLFINKNQIIVDNYNELSLENGSTIDKKINELMRERKVYFMGWPFSNPAGIKKHHNEIVRYFRPKDKYLKRIEKKMNNFREKYQRIVGIHIRQGDYYRFKNGELLIKQKDFEKRMIEIQRDCASQILFIICSDGEIKIKNDNLNIHQQRDIEIVDLYTLAMCDKVVGSDSTFGRWAAMYGQIPFELINTKQSEIPHKIEVVR